MYSTSGISGCDFDRKHKATSELKEFGLGVRTLRMKLGSNNSLVPNAELRELKLIGKELSQWWSLRDGFLGNEGRHNGTPELRDLSSRSGIRLSSGSEI